MALLLPLVCNIFFLNLLMLVSCQQERDSGWALHKIHYLIVNINRFNPLHAGCKINLPSAITSRKALINLETSDNACFAWSVTAALYPAKPTAHPNRTSSYPHFRTVLDVGSLTFPTTLKQIPKFETDNDVSVNIFTLENDIDAKIVPLQVTKKKRSRHANLLLVNDEQGAGHFMSIRNLSRLVRSQFTKNKIAHYICDRYVIIMIQI
ncbi:uncharacterized protein [Prorops nasuta]|uniref:uncharacterized protein n=1 Tax=Prorops nasuta TaxID=863751 RepID=UPI0034CEB1EA